MFTLINICALNRSGSTLFDLMLGNGDDAFSCGEIYARFRPWRPHHFETKCECGDPDCQVWSLLEGASAKDFHATVSKEIGVPFVVDSSKELCWVLDANRYVVESGGRIINLVLWKQPETLAFSYWKRGRSVDDLIREYVDYYGKFIALNIPFLSVEFDALVKSPSQYLKRVCEVTGLSYFEGKENFGDKKHHHLFGSAGTREQSLRPGALVKGEVDYPDSFLSELDDIKRALSSDDGLAGIVKRLEEREIMTCNEEVAITSLNALPRPLSPLWYYSGRIKRYIRRFVNDKQIV